MSAHAARILAAFGRIAEAQRHECAARRGRVLAYADLRQRLTEPPINHLRPEDWNGYIPPAQTGDGEMNTSPRRRALVEISAEALRRERDERNAGPDGL